MKKLVAAFCLSSILSTGIAHAQSTQDLGAEELMQAVHQEIQLMEPMDRADFQKKLDRMLAESERTRMFRKMSGRDAWITPFTCIGAQAGIGLSGMLLKCVNTRGQTFEVTVIGLRPAALLSGNVALGYTKGPVENGALSITLEAGGYYGFGGSAYLGKDIGLLAPGVGIGGHVNFGVPADSMVGGQVVIENATPANSVR